MLITWLMSMVLAQQPIPLELTLEVSPETVEGQRQIAMRAIEACRGRYPQLGRYSFEGSSGAEAGATRFTYRGEVTCLDAPPPPPPGAPVEDGWRASAADEAAARAMTMAYFAAIDRGDVAAWEAMMAQSYRGTATTAERRARNAAFRRDAGTPGIHRVVRTTWYVNPPGVPPGAYVAVDFDRAYSGFNVSCGYVAWHRQADGSLQLVREEMGNDRRAGDLAPERRAEIRRQLQCRD